MDTRPRRPVSVWIAQLLLTFLSMLFLIPIAVLLMKLMANPRLLPIVGTALAVAIHIAFISAMQAAFWGMVKRRPYGRWLGVGILSLIFVFSIIGQISRPEGPMEYYEYENATQAAAGLITQLLMSGLLLWLILTLSFSKKVSVFFQGYSDASLGSSSAELSVD